MNIKNNISFIIGGCAIFFGGTIYALAFTSNDTQKNEIHEIIEFGEEIPNSEAGVLGGLEEFLDATPEQILHLKELLETGNPEEYIEFAESLLSESLIFDTN